MVSQDENLPLHEPHNSTGWLRKSCRLSGTKFGDRLRLSLARAQYGKVKGASGSCQAVVPETKFQFVVPASADSPILNTMLA